jgi:acylphosphatase
MISAATIVLLLNIFFVQVVISFNYFQLSHAYLSTIERKKSPLYAISEKETDVVKARISVALNGPHAIHPLFRAELKKELTFFRRCSGKFNEINTNSAHIIAEGKKQQLERFIQWLEKYSVPLVKRKVSFQGPSLLVYVHELKWEEYNGDLKGFIIEAPGNNSNNNQKTNNTKDAQPVSLQNG